MNTNIISSYRIEYEEDPLWLLAVCDLTLKFSLPFQVCYLFSAIFFQQSDGLRVVPSLFLCQIFA